MLSIFCIQYLTKEIETSSIKYHYQVLPYQTMFAGMLDLKGGFLSSASSRNSEPCLHTRRRMLEGIFTLNLKLCVLFNNIGKGIHQV